MAKEYRQLTWDADVEHDCRQLVRLAILEDLERGHDWTTVALASEEARSVANLVARQSGVIAGIEAARITLEEMEIAASWEPQVADGAKVERGALVARLRGPARGLLTAERTLLNLMGRMSGIATLTSEYVAAVAGTGARVYDTRKTTPGWRRLEKYSVRCGGGHNHRLGLFDGVLIKDNHLALGREGSAATRYTPAQAVQRAKAFLYEHGAGQERFAEMMVEVEVDSLAQLREVLPAGPDIVLLDNMPPDVLRQAVAIRNELAPHIELEASGGITLKTIRSVAETGVERISSGALTHSAIVLDVALDWQE
ncbi:Nicotinate-nucleotide pyrophosphorylase [carboxylating] [Anatilimnocola aggregata]|uniref:Probable nicotinate-nucleotide pyrophosphorylase [carboxylating] n=1 Tax=Anatilimnocola aggregata TaxID=2528021 RepID=A0A517Y5F0_9BACT|nr:carboxylating nicotinate-nucleotide diphosphorylase [Anatilimnocola aggregata]QDU25352.1 Nicotinate-nucleotide pyrophosphorylase [carboxylating] [Anatilimnocola aggregata]